MSETIAIIPKAASKKQRGRARRQARDLLRSLEVANPSQNRGKRRVNKSSVTDQIMASQREAAKTAAFAMSTPRGAMDSHMTPGYPDLSKDMTARVWTTTQLSFSGVVHPLGGYTARVAVTANMNAQIRRATQITPTWTWANTNVHGYSDFAASVDLYRAVAMGAELRCTSAVLDLGGLRTFALIDCDEISVDIGVIQDSQTQFTGVNGKPGDVLNGTWVGKNGIGSEDYVWMAPTTACTPKSTTILFDANAATNLSYHLSVYTLWEYVPDVTAAPLSSLSLFQADPVTFSAALDAAFSELPLFSQGRCSFQDDGKIEAIVGDVKSIFGGIKSGVSLGKKIYKFGSSFMSDPIGAIGSLFGATLHPASRRTRAERALRFLLALPEQQLEELLSKMSLAVSGSTSKTPIRDLLTKMEQTMTHERESIANSKRVNQVCAPETKLPVEPEEVKSNTFVVIPRKSKAAWPEPLSPAGSVTAARRLTAAESASLDRNHYNHD